MIIVHGGPASQPSRAVFWTCLLKAIPFRIVPPDYLNTAPLESLNPRKQVPVLEDGEFALFEMAAIMIYLCEKYGGDDMLPKTVEARARVHQYLHMHHSLSRSATMKLMAPHVTVAFREGLETKMARDEANDSVMDPMQRTMLLAALADPEMLTNGRRTAALISRVIEKSYFSDGDVFLVGNRPTIADIACYSELAQLRWAGLFDFEGFEKINRWFEIMAELPYHDTIHQYNVALGDILAVPNTAENFAAATQAGMQALAELGIPVENS
ncbi:MAG: glutathione S-transferase family protein [Parasphingopyxis sp.]|uniref:glutathione S-transferase family protein n=1 Tax=Parasphingopyxis sp. TaxID=1920299 RepID=UPI002624F74B|nr:glutathione S-transferase family protein [uncultured Parasphingopyxis sp.]